MLMINFLDLKEGAYEALADLVDRDHPGLFLYRKNGYRHNRKKLLDAKRDNPNVNVYTDDETMLEFAEYDTSIHSFNVRVAFQSLYHTEPNWTPLFMIYPNLRPANSLLKMYYSGALLDDFKKINGYYL